MQGPGDRGAPRLGPGWAAARGSAPGLHSLLQRGTWRPIRRRPGRTSYRVETPRGVFFAKHYRPEGILRSARLMVLRRVPARAFHRGRGLHGKGLSTPAPLALYLGGLLCPREAVLVTEWIEGLSPWVTHLREAPPDRRAVAAAVGALVGHLHRFGYYHEDLAGHLFLGRGGRGGRPYLVGLEGLRRPLTRRRRVKNLEELARGLGLDELGLRERWWGLRAYGSALGLERGELRRLWREGREIVRRRGAEGGRTG